MKKILIGVLAVLILMIFASTAALASGNDLVLITESGGAILYDSYDEDEAQPLAIIPEGAVAMHIATIDWGYCVTFGNYAGYIYEYDGVLVNGKYYDYELPDGTDYSFYDDDEEDDWDTTYVPEFPYDPIDCYGIEKIATRSGPDGDYTWHGSYPQTTDLTILYQTMKGGVRWCYLEFEANHSRYRVYTSMKRVVVDDYVPDDAEDYVTARITSGHTPRLGPGNDYASAENYTSSGTKVRAFYQEDGWLLYEYTLDNGEIQRGWAPPGYWK